MCALSLGWGQLTSNVYAGVDGLNQAAWIAGTDKYQFGYNSIANIKISGAPADTDYKRSAMLFDGGAYRLYFFKEGSDTTLYQFAWNGTTYQYGYSSIPILTITGKPSDADSGSFSMLHDGLNYRLYMLSQNKQSVYQFAWNGSAYQFGFSSIPNIAITNAPADTDKSRWAMLHDGASYRMYFGKNGTVDKLYPFAWNGSSYAYGFNSLPMFTLVDIPANSDTSHFNMLNDRSNNRFYFLSKTPINVQNLYGQWHVNDDITGLNEEHYVPLSTPLEERRFRSAMNIYSNGGAEVFRLAPNDAHYYVRGNWTFNGFNLVITFTDTHPAPMGGTYVKTYEVLKAENSVLNVKLVSLIRK